jgi:antitoxin (DNA-binding transcriptional repressor) of toxin-antitoxin stability system
MEIVDIYDAGTRLPELADRAAAGEDILIARDGAPVARLTRLLSPARRIRFGVLEGRIQIGSDFDALLPDDVLARFNGR